MFLEEGSDFLGENVGLKEVHRLPELASSLLKELNLMHKNAQEAALDKPGKSTKYLKIEHLRNIDKAFTPSESKLREIIPKMMSATGQPALLAPLREEMAEVLKGMAKALRPENTMPLREMATQLLSTVETQDRVGGAIGAC
jgi:hypothetical protein